MDIDSLKFIISESVEELPGWEAQKLLSPPYREEYNIEEIKKNNPKIAAVMILLYENQEKEVEFPIILRVISSEDIHSNQFSLPGGSYEAEDISLDETAIRESVEELGLEYEKIEILKQLSEIYIPPSDFLVYPFVGYYPESPDFIPEETEVQYILPINLESFLAANPTTFEKHFSGYKVDVPGYQIGEEEYIWGATAMILEEFKVFIKNILTL